MSSRHATARRYARATGAAVVALGLLSLLAWALGLDTLRGLGSVKPNTALCFVAAGAGLYVYARRPESRVPRLCGIAVLVVGGATLAEYILGGNLGIDELLLDDPDAAAMTDPGRMAPNTALAFILLGAGLAIPSVRVTRFWLGSLLPLLASAIGLVGVVGYTAAVPSLYGVGHLTRMALPTAIALCALGAGIAAARPERGVAELLTGDGPGASLARRMLLAVTVLPPVLGALIWEGAALGLYGNRVGLLIVLLAVMSTIGAVAWSFARSVDRADAARRSALEVLQLSEERARNVIEGAHEAFVSIDKRGRITDWNAQAVRVFGWSREEALGRGLAETIIPERFRERHRQGLRRFLEVGEGEVVNTLVALDALHRDGHELPVELTVSPQRVPDGWQFNAFIRDVSDRKRHEEERDRFNAELERSNEELEQFAYVASHDLSEPLRVIAGFVQLLQRRYEGRLDEQADRFIEATVDGVERMEAMIDALLEVSRIGQTKVGAELVDCERAADQARGNLHLLISEHKADLEIGELPDFVGEPALIGELFQNLISNAVKYGDPEMPKVSVSADRSNGEWIFSVVDNGAGIDPRQSARVFEMFKRLHGRDQAGAGIGLAICKRIVEKHGGRIWVEPGSDGGSAFRFAVPASPDGLIAALQRLPERRS